MPEVAEVGHDLLLSLFAVQPDCTDSGRGEGLSDGRSVAPGAVAARVPQFRITGMRTLRFVRVGAVISQGSQSKDVFACPF